MNGGFPLSSSSKTKFRPPRPPSTDTEEAAAAVQPKKAESESSSPDLFGIMDAIMGGAGDGSKSAKWKLEQLENLEGQLGKLKTTITEAKSQASKELEQQKETVGDLEKNLAFVELKHQVGNVRVFQETQHDRLKDVVGILNNHADRLATIEDSIAEMRHDMKRTSLNSMSERLLEKLLKTHEARPHFLLELFELACELDTDQKRAQVINSVKNVMVCEKMLEIKGLEKKLEEAKDSSTVPAIESRSEAQTPVQRINDALREIATAEETSQTEQTAESDVIPSDTNVKKLERMFLK